MDNLLLAFSEVQIRPQVSFAPEAAIRPLDVMEELGQWPTPEGPDIVGLQFRHRSASGELASIKPGRSHGIVSPTAAA